MSHDATTPSSPSSTPAPTPAQQRLSELLEAVNAARRAVEAEEAAAARQVKIDRINARLAGQIDALQQQINALQARQRQLEGRRITSAPSEPQEPQAASTPRQAGSAQPWKNSATYQVWYQLRARHKDARAITQKELTAFCKEQGVALSVTPTAEQLDALHARLVAAGKISAK